MDEDQAYSPSCVDLVLQASEMVEKCCVKLAKLGSRHEMYPELAAEIGCIERLVCFGEL